MCEKILFGTDNTGDCVLGLRQLDVLLCMSIFSLVQILQEIVL